MDLKNKYFIKSTYIPNDKVITLDSVSSSQYWNKKRFKSSLYYQYYVYKFALKILHKYNFNSLIDVGCGTGKKLAYIHKKLPKLKIVGIDQKSVIEYCKETYPFGQWFVDNIENPKDSLKNLKADLIIASDVIEHLLDPDYLLTYLALRVKKKGFILLSTPERNILRGKKCNYSPNINHVREWNFREFEDYLINFGFKIEEHFLQYPVKIGFNSVIFYNILSQFVKFNRIKYNQVCLLRLLN